MTVFLLGLQKVSHGWVGCDKGFSWFVEVEQAIAIVEKGGRVKISSCWICPRTLESSGVLVTSLEWIELLLFTLEVSHIPVRDAQFADISVVELYI